MPKMTPRGRFLKIEAKRYQNRVQAMLDDATYEQLCLYADIEEVPMSSLIRTILEQFIKDLSP